MATRRMCSSMEQATLGAPVRASALLPVLAYRGQVGTARERLHVEAIEAFANGAELGEEIRDNDRPALDQDALNIVVGRDAFLLIERGTGQRRQLVELWV